MAAGIMRAEKVKTMGELAGREIHNERKREHSNTNPDIDRNRTRDNYSIGEYDKRSYSQRIEQEIAERYKGGRAIRKDAVKCIELMFTADKSFFDRLTPEQEKAYFRSCYDFVADHFGGRANIVADKVHKDEKTPHIHLCLVPLTKDGRLSARDYLGGKKELQQLQDAFYSEVSSKWGLERGNRADLEHGESGRRHKTTGELKLETEITRKRGYIEKADKMILERENILKKDLLTAEEVERIPSKPAMFDKDKVVISAKDFDDLKKNASVTVNLLQEIEPAREINRRARKIVQDAVNEAKKKEAEGILLLDKAKKEANNLHEKLASAELRGVKAELAEVKREHPEWFQQQEHRKNRNRGRE